VKLCMLGVNEGLEGGNAVEWRWLCSFYITLREVSYEKEGSTWSQSSRMTWVLAGPGRSWLLDLHCKKSSEQYIFRFAGSFSGVSVPESALTWGTGAAKGSRHIVYDKFMTQSTYDRLIVLAVARKGRVLGREGYTARPGVRTKRRKE
jgi:hypothetical protein